MLILVMQCCVVFQNTKKDVDVFKVLGVAKKYRLGFVGVGLDLTDALSFLEDDEEFFMSKIG